MGARTFVNLRTTNETTGVNEQTHRPVRLGIDVPLLLITITLLIFGLLMVYSASSDFSFQYSGEADAIFQRQIQWVGLGLLAAVVFTWLDYHIWQKLAVPAMIVVLGALLLVLFLNQQVLGAARSISGGSIQPSELAKIVLIIYLSVWLYARRDQLMYVGFGLAPLGLIVGAIGGLILLQPDLSATITVFILGTMLFFLAGGDLKHLLLLLAIAIGAGYGVVQLSSTGLARIISFWEGLKDPLNSSDHVQRSLEAFIRGGWIGVGIGKSETKLTGLPFPHTDSIFAVVGEETGVIGAALLILLFAALMWRGLKISQKAPDRLGSLLAAGLSFWVTAEAMINMAVMVGLMPFAGNALPFISSGGSSMLVTLSAIGIIMNVARKSVQKQENEERSFSAIVDLRGRDRRRRVSSPRRTTPIGQ